MPRTPKGTPPIYRKASRGQDAVVGVTDTLGRRHELRLGLYGTPESKQEYARVLRILDENHGRYPVHTTNPKSITLVEMALAFLDHAKIRYRAGKEYGEHRYAIDPLLKLFSDLPVAEFGPRKLRLVRDEMVKQGISRKVINRRVIRLRTMFKWATSEELIPGGILEALKSVAALSPGTPGVKEATPRKPASYEDVQPLLPHMPHAAAAILELCALTGGRPGEIRVMRATDLDTSDPECWSYQPGSDAGPNGAHKNAWRGQDRRIALGPKCIELLRPRLEGREPSEYLFNPARARQELDVKRSENRKSRPTPKQAASRERNRQRAIPNKCYSDCNFSQAVRRAARRVNSTVTPYALRHGVKMRITRQHGADAARAVLGQKSIDATQHYGSIDHEHARDVMRGEG